MMNDSTKNPDGDVAIKRTIGYWKGYVLVPYHNKIFFANVEQSIKEGQAVIQNDSLGYEMVINYGQLPSF